MKRGILKRLTVLVISAAVLLMTGCSGDLYENDLVETDSFFNENFSETEQITALSDLDMTVMSITEAYEAQPDESSENPETVKMEGALMLVPLIGEGLPSETVLDEAFEMLDWREIISVSMTADGVFSAVSADDIYDSYMVSYYAEMMTEDYYNEMLTDEYYNEYYGSFTYSRWVETLLLMIGDYAKYFDENGKQIKSAAVPSVYFTAHVKIPENTEEFSAREIYGEAVKDLINVLRNDPNFVDEMNTVVTGGDSFFARLDGEYEGNGIVSYEDVYGDIYSWGSFYDKSGSEHYISMTGRELAVIGGQYVFTDTEKLFITSRDKSTAVWLAGDYLPEDCFILYDDPDDVYYSGVVYDMAAIAAELPDLKELYMYQAFVENREAIAEMSELTALAYYVSENEEYFYNAVSDAPFVGLTKLKTLRLYGSDYSSYDFLNAINSLEEVYISTKSNDIKTIFDCPVVTELELKGSKPELEGIDKLVNLKKLDISSGIVDCTYLSGLNALETLYISCRSPENLSELGKLSSVTELSLNSMENYDWKFLKKMTSLRSLSLLYIEEIYDEDIEPLKNLTDLSMVEIKTTYSIIEELPNLKSVYVDGINGSINGLGGSESLQVYCEIFGNASFDYAVLADCPNLREITLLGCNGTFDAADFADLPLENICLDGTELINPEALADIKTLKYVYLTYYIDQELADSLAKTLPECEFKINQEQSFTNIYDD